MRILIAPDSFGGTLTSHEAAAAIATGWAQIAPGDELTVLPLSDGGPGFISCLSDALGGQMLAITVAGPFGDAVPAVLLRHGDTVYVESAHAIGRELIPAESLDPMRATSVGLGQLLLAALETGATRIVVGLGGTVTNDAGAGLLAGLLTGLGLESSDVLSAGGGTLSAASVDDVAGLTRLRSRFADVELIAAVDVDVPLLGLTGASAGFAEQKGATADEAQQLEAELGAFSWEVAAAIVQGEDEGRHRVNLLDVPDGPAGSGSESSRIRQVRTELIRAPGAGAAGGVGFALAALGGRLISGAEVVAQACQLSDRIAASDLVVTGEGSLDWQSLHGKVIAAVSDRAVPHAVPCVVIAGQVHLGRREWGSAGVSAVYSLTDGTISDDEAIANATEHLTTRASTVARTWSR